MSRTYLASDFPALDQALRGGWPAGGVIELHGLPGSGKTTLLLPTIVRATHNQERSAIICCNNVIYPPTLWHAGGDTRHILWVAPHSDQQACWAIQQILNSGLFSLLILNEIYPTAHDVRRWQLACEKLNITLFMLTTKEGRENMWALTLRCHIQRKSEHQIHFDILRTRQFIDSFSGDIDVKKITYIDDTHQSHHRTKKLQQTN